MQLPCVVTRKPAHSVPKVIYGTIWEAKKFSICRHYTEQCEENKTKTISGVDEQQFSKNDEKKTTSVVIRVAIVASGSRE